MILLLFITMFVWRAGCVRSQFNTRWCRKHEPEIRVSFPRAWDFASDIEPRSDIEIGFAYYPMQERIRFLSGDEYIQVTYLCLRAQRRDIVSKSPDVVSPDLETYSSTRIHIFFVRSVFIVCRIRNIN